MSLPLVVGLTGASGAVYARRLLEVLIADGREVHISISPSASLVFQQELGVEIDLARFDPSDAAWLPRGSGKIHYHHFQDYLAPIASGSFLTGGMVICPCSGSTLSAIVHEADCRPARDAAFSTAAH